MTYETLPYQSVSFKGAHNSYQRKETLLQQLAWSQAQPWQCGCRALEIDIARHSDNTHGTSASYFQVTHDQGGTGPTLSQYLSQLTQFHNAAPNHDPVFVTLDIKSQDGDASVFPDEIDAYLKTWFLAAQILTPDAVRKNAKTLWAGVQANGWPTVGAMQGKFIFCLSGTEAWKEVYVRAGAGRLCFADFAFADNSATAEVPVDGGRVVANANLFSADTKTWTGLVQEYRRQGILVRGYVLNSSSLWADAKAAGVNVLATDEVSDNGWAAVGTEPFVAS